MALARWISRSPSKALEAEREEDILKRPMERALCPDNRAAVGKSYDSRLTAFAPIVKNCQNLTVQNKLVSAYSSFCPNTWWRAKSFVYLLLRWRQREASWKQQRKNRKIENTEFSFTVIRKSPIFWKSTGKRSRVVWRGLLVVDLGMGIPRITQVDRAICVCYGGRGFNQINNDV